MATYAGIDLHSSNLYLGIIDGNDQRLYGRRVPNNLNRILATLDPFQDTLEAVVVESTFNWYKVVLDSNIEVDIEATNALRKAFQIDRRC